MSREQKTFITDVNGKRWTFPLTEGEPDPDLYEVRIEYAKVTPDGSTEYLYGSNTKPTTKAIHVPRSVFAEHGVALTQSERKQPDVPPESLEDLLTRILEYLGVYPQQ